MYWKFIGIEIDLLFMIISSGAGSESRICETSLSPFPSVAPVSATLDTWVFESPHIANNIG